MVKFVKFLATDVLPNHKETLYWVDLKEDPAGGIIKYYNREGEWVILKTLDPHDVTGLIDRVEALEEEVIVIDQRLDNLTWDDVHDKPIFAMVAFTGSYNDLLNKPEIPSLVGYATQEWVNTRLQTKLNTLIPGSGISIIGDTISSTLDISLYIVVPELPTENILTNKIYLVLSEDETEQDKYLEYLYINGEWELIGKYEAEIDLSEYLKKAEAAGTYQLKGDYALSSDIPSRVSQLTNDAGYLQSETDPTVPAHVKGITQANITTWNNKSTFSGKYGDLTEIPTLFNPAPHTHQYAGSDTIGGNANASNALSKVGSDLTTSYAQGTTYSYLILSGSTNLIFPTINNANAALTFNTHSGDFYHQLGLSSNGRIYSRTLVNAPLTTAASWNTVAWYSDITWANIQGTKFIEIPSGADLNSYTSAGNYRTSSNAIALTVLNSPTSVAFWLEVGQHAGSYQRLVEYTTAGFRVYERNYYGGTWGIWYRAYNSATGVAWTEVTGKPTEFEPAPHTHLYAGSSTAGGSASTAQSLARLSNAIISISPDRVRFDSRITGNTPGLFPSTTDANAALTMNTGSGNNYFQIGVSSNGKMYTRNFIDAYPDSTSPWESLIYRSELDTDLSSKQNTLVSGTNIKTINGVSVLGSGDIVIGEDGGITANPLTLLINGTTQTTFDGSAVSNFNVTPTNLGVYTKGEIDASTTIVLDEIETKQDVLVSGTNIKTVNSLSLVGSGNVTIPTFSGNYNDLTNKPTTFKPILYTGIDWDSHFNDNDWGFLNGSVGGPLDGSSVMGINVPLRSTSGMGMQLAARFNKLYFRTKEAGVIGNWYTVLHSGNSGFNPTTGGIIINGVSSTVSLSTHTHTKNLITDFPTSMPASDVSAWAKAATKPSYSYSEITGTVPSSTTPNSLTFTGSSTGVFNGSNALTINIPAATTSLPWTSITGKPNFGNVAISNSYDDLDNKPAIPDVSLLVSKEQLEEDLLTKVNVSQKINGKSYGTADITLTPNDINTYSKSEIENLIMQVNTAQFRGPYATIQEFPTPYDTNDLYLLGTTAPYRIYAYIDSGLKEIGSSATDLSNYYSKTETDTKLSTKQNTLVSGTSIKTINGTTVLGAGNIAVSTFSGNYNDLTNKPTSLPASDVSAWAKQPNKPEYTYSEVGAAPLVHNHNSLYEPIFSKNTAFNKNFGTTSGTVTQGNDSRLSDARTPLAHTHTVSQITDFPTSMPASDVSAWAKAATKPTYTWTEITSKPTTFTPSAHTHNMNEVLDATIINVPVGTITRKTIIANGKTSQGFNSRVALGLSNLSDKFAPAILSVGLNEDGTEWLNYVFDTNGRIYSGGNTVAFTTDAPAAHNQGIDTISDVNATWKTILKSAPSAFVTRWPTYAEVTGKPSTFTPSAHTHTLSDITDVANVTVSWANVTSKPTTFAPSAHTHAWSEITSKPTFATVATSGSYNDLTNKPTIPSAYTLPTASTSVKGGVRVGDGMVMDGERMGIASYFLNHLAFIVEYSELYEYPNAGELQIDKHLLVFNGVTPAISPLHLNNSIDVGKEILCSFINNTSDSVVRLPSTQPYNGINYHLMDGSEIEIKAGKATEISFLLVSSTDVVVSSKTSL